MSKLLKDMEKRSTGIINSIRKDYERDKINKHIELDINFNGYKKGDLIEITTNNQMYITDRLLNHFNIKDYDLVLTAEPNFKNPINHFRVMMYYDNSLHYNENKNDNTAPLNGANVIVIGKITEIKRNQ